VAGMNPSDPPAVGSKKNSLGVEQPLNDPMMPVVWTRHYGNTRVLTTTMGSAQDLSNEGFRRLLVNGAYWLSGLRVPEKLDVSLVGEYTPSPFSFGGFKKGVRPVSILGRDLAQHP
jgi:hypothetical protein